MAPVWRGIAQAEPNPESRRRGGCLGHHVSTVEAAALTQSRSREAVSLEQANEINPARRRSHFHWAAKAPRSGRVLSILR